VSIDAFVYDASGIEVIAMSLDIAPQYLATRAQALLMMREARLTDPNFIRFYWFPDEREVRLVEVAKDVPSSTAETIEPFYFPPAPDFEMPALSGVAVISAEDDRRLTPPAGWGSWNSAVELPDSDHDLV
jgi:hypothetical protein